LLVHIGDPSSNQATTLESQVIHIIQELFGQTLRPSPMPRNEPNSARLKVLMEAPASRLIPPIVKLRRVMIMSKSPQ
jgi:hypothetical protein